MGVEINKTESAENTGPKTEGAGEQAGAETQLGQEGAGAVGEDTLTGGEAGADNGAGEGAGEAGQGGSEAAA